jgi:uncharacterized protein (DUF58 family)
MTKSSPRYLDPYLLNKIAKLEIKARLVVEGFIAGLHKSPYHGFSVEFAQHREYVPGDDLKHWKVWGRSDRLYVKEYEQETNLTAHILLDTSESMDYRSAELSKLEYACYMVSALSHLIVRQQDAVGLVLFDRTATKFIQPSTSPVHMKEVLTTLENVTPQKKTDMAAVLHDVAERIKKKGMVIIISDLFDDPKSILMGLQHFRHKKHDVIVLHTMDEYEMSFPFQRMTRFEGMEEYPDVLTDPRALRQAYKEEVQNFITTLRRGCLQQRVDYVPITTDQPVDVALSTYLATRLGTRIK